MKYVIASCVQEDGIWAPGIGEEKRALGGAGLYAYAGIRIFEDNVALLCNVERGHLKNHCAWYERNCVETAGIFECLENDGITKVVYSSNGSREDVPQAGLEKKRLRNPSIAQLEQTCIAGEREKNRVKGVYMFRHFDESYLRDAIRLSKIYRFLILWELAADSAAEEYFHEIVKLCRDISVFSLNVEEAGMLTGYGSGEDIMSCFQREGFPCVFLRCGSEGAWILTPDERYFCPSVPGCEVVDTTGAGNASSGAVLYGICEGEALGKAGIMGSVAASCIIRQYGPPSVFSRAMRDGAWSLSENMYKKQRRNEYV